VALAQIAEMAAKIKNEKQLRAILLDAHLGLRIHVYNQIVPYLTFSPRAYRKLMRHA